MSGDAETHGASRAAGLRRRRRLSAAAGALAVHGLALFAVLSSWSAAPLPPEPPAMEVSLIALEPPPQVVAPPKPEPDRAAAPAKPAGPRRETPPKPAAIKPPPAPKRLVRKPEPSEVAPRIVPPEPAPQITEVAVSAAALAAATTADSNPAGEEGLGAGYGDGIGGGGLGSGAGGRCDMVRRLQRALRNDATVRSALAQARRAPGFEGRPLVVWNGDWIRHANEEGKGLASVRQAISVEVAFAPKACRTQSMRGLVLLSLNDGPGSARVVLGSGAWRWADLLHAR